MARKELDPEIKNRGKTFAKKLREVREQKSLSRNDLSKKSNVPVDTVLSIENGRILSPGLFIAADLVYALEGTLDEWLAKRKPATHRMRLHKIPFDATKKGTKTLEVRLLDPKRRSLQIGDAIVFERIEGSDHVRAEVVGLRTYKTLNELTLDEDFKKTGGIYKNRTHWVKSIDSYYTKSDQKQYGLLVIEIKRS